MDFIDVEGASGRSYRFRLWREQDGHPPIAGNYAVVDSASPSPSLLLIGVTNDLAGVGARARARAKGALFTRLNVARTTREAEHEDIVARHPDAEIVSNDP